MGDDNTNQKERKPKWTSYSKITCPEVEERLGFRLSKLEADAIPIRTMLDGQSGAVEEGAVNETKAKVYDRIVEYIVVEGYPTESENFTTGNIRDLVGTVIVSIMGDFKRKTGRQSIRLQRRKEIISADCEIDGMEGCIVIDLISVTEDRFIFITEAKRGSLGEAKKQCLLSMKDMGDRSGAGEVYGFVTSGDSWRMIRYDGSFQMTDEFDIVFGGIGEDKETWMKDYSVLVDCMNVALGIGHYRGGIVKKDAVP